MGGLLAAGERGVCFKQRERRGAGRRAGGRFGRQCFPEGRVLTWVALPLIPGVGDGQFASE